MINQAKASIIMQNEASGEQNPSSSINRNPSENSQNVTHSADSLAPPSTLLGRTLSASAADYRGTWRNKKGIPSPEKNQESQV
jgi:hypothetical protein